MKLNRILGIIGILIIVSCSPKITSYIVSESKVDLDESEIIHIYEVEDNIPAESTLIGNINIGDTGLSTDCKYDKVISEAKNEAKKAKANIIKITELKRPDLLSSCYRLKADLYFAENIPKSRSLAEGSNYALIHFYRPNNFHGSAIKFKILDSKGSQIIGLKNDSRFTYRTTTYGEQVFWAPKIGKQSLTINIEEGQEYFVNCKMVQTFSGSDKTMQLVRSEKGEKEMNETKRKQ